MLIFFNLGVGHTYFTCFFYNFSVEEFSSKFLNNARLSNIIAKNISKKVSFN